MARYLITFNHTLETEIVDSVKIGAGIDPKPSELIQHMTDNHIRRVYKHWLDGVEPGYYCYATSPHDDRYFCVVSREVAPGHFVQIGRVRRNRFKRDTKVAHREGSVTVPGQGRAS